MRALIIEDDAETAGFIAKGLSEGGFAVDVAHDGRDGLVLALGSDYDVAVVDRMLPELDGIAIVEAMRSAGRKTPVLFLSAKGEVADRVAGLRAGADDYLVKPFAFSELRARVDALLRRGASPAKQTVLRVGDLEMDLLARRVTRAGRRMLQRREFQLLECLMRSAGRVVHPDDAARTCMGLPFRPPDQCHRRPYLQAPPQGRCRRRKPAHRDRARRGVQAPCRNGLARISRPGHGLRRAQAPAPPGAGRRA